MGRRHNNEYCSFGLDTPCTCPAWMMYEADEEGFCTCLAAEDPFPHTPEDHKFDCYTPPPCGGCYRCLAMQVAYYRMLEQEEERNGNQSNHEGN